MFNPGQQVKCIDDSGCRPLLKNGNIYTVAHEFNEGELADHRGREGGGVMLLNHRNPRSGELQRPPYFYRASRFEAVGATAPTPCNCTATAPAADPVPAPVASNSGSLSRATVQSMIEEAIEEHVSDRH